MSNYTHTNRGQLKAQIVAMSGDLDKIHWTDAEWNSYIEEAFILFSGISEFHKDFVQIHTKQNKKTYDIFSDCDDNTSIAPSITFGKVCNWISFVIIEDMNNLSPLLFNSIDDFLMALEGIYNEFQARTGLVLQHSQVDILANNHIVLLDNSVIDIVRAEYQYEIDGITYYKILHRSDEESITYDNSSDIFSIGESVFYSTVYDSPNKLKLYPIPNVTGKLNLITVNSRNNGSHLTTDTIVMLPNGLVPYLKYGFLAQLYSRDGLLNDPARANYFNQRWEEGIQVGRLYASILLGLSNGVPLLIDSINKQDVYNISSKSDDPTAILGLAGLNIFAIDNLPINNDVNSIMLSVNVNPPPLVDDNSHIDIKIEYIEPITDYCLHLAQMKGGFPELGNTQNYLSGFIQTALNHNKRLQKLGFNFAAVTRKTKKEEIEYPRLAEVNN